MSKRHSWEWGLWTIYLLTAFLANSVIAWFDLGRGGSEFHTWEPVVWEFTSAIVQGFLILVILRFDRRFPIQPDTWRSHLIAHALFTVVYSLLHVTLMYWMRVALYELIGNNEGYLWHDWWVEFGYEYLKDFRTYFSFLAVIYLYRFVLRRWQGEAGFLTEGEDTEPVAVADRFLIKKLGREFLVRVEQIDWIESSGNYVNLHVGERVYPLRETMTNINQRLASHGFQRVHRGAIVNLDRIDELVMFGTNDGEVCLTSGARVPSSRRYRKELRERLAS
ncbi:MAG: LytR/AlgR family response regulator transcription factor [Gammaproteobacteria bacterium]